MITPLFECSQSETHVTVRIRAPHSRLRDIEISTDDKDLHFYCSPYLLHLRFSHGVQLDPENSPASYDIHTGIANIPLQKCVPGVYFERLDMLSALLVRRESASSQHRPLSPAPPRNNIEVLSSTEVRADEDKQRERQHELLEIPDVPAGNTWLPMLASASTSLAEANRSFQQDVATIGGVEIALKDLSIGRPRYGFAGRYEAIFSARAEDTSEIVELPQPDETPVWRRNALRKEAEDRKFDAEHYVADFMLHEEFEHVMKYTFVYEKELSQMKNSWKDVLLKLPKREYLSDVHGNACADLAGLLCASCYDERSTEGERNVESAWTVARLCPTFAFLEQMRSVEQAVLAVYRRSLAYPLYRNVALAKLVVEDLKKLTCAQNVDSLRARLLRVLLELRELFEEHRMLRIFCDIYLTDYCVWIQQVPNETLAKFAEDVRNVVAGKEFVGWDLEKLEQRAVDIANGVLREETDEEKVQEDTNGELQEEDKVIEDSRVLSTQGVMIGAVTQPGFEMTPVITRSLKKAPGSESTSSSEYDSDSSSSSDDRDSSDDERLRMSAPTPTGAT